MLTLLATRLVSPSAERPGITLADVAETILEHLPLHAPSVRSLPPGLSPASIHEREHQRQRTLRRWKTELLDELLRSLAAPLWHRAISDCQREYAAQRGNPREGL